MACKIEKPLKNIEYLDKDAIYVIENYYWDNGKFICILDDCKVIVPTDKFNNIPERVNKFFLLHHFIQYNSSENICYHTPHHGSCICWECEDCFCELYSYEKYRECPCIHNRLIGAYPYNVDNYYKKCKELEDKFDF